MPEGKEAVEKKAEQTADQKAAVDEKNKSVKTPAQAVADKTANQEADTDETNDDDDGTDYELELERVQKERDNWKQAALNAKDKAKRKAAGADEQPPVIDPNEVEKMIGEKVGSEITKLREDMAAERIEFALDSLTPNLDKQKLIKFHYDNSIVKSGFSRGEIAADMRKALALADSSKILRENDELKKTVNQKKSMTSDSMGNNQDRIDATKKKMPKLSPDDLALLARRKIDPSKIQTLQSQQ